MSQLEKDLEVLKELADYAKWQVNLPNDKEPTPYCFEKEDLEALTRILEAVEELKADNELLDRTFIACDKQRVKELEEIAQLKEQNTTLKAQFDNLPGVEEIAEIIRVGMHFELFNDLSPYKPEKVPGNIAQAIHSRLHNQPKE
jgi:hypothetical protein